MWNLLAPEVLHGIFQEVHPTDLASLSLTCRHLNSFITNDVLLWRIHYLRLCDLPHDVEEAADVYWQTKLKEVIRLQKILNTRNLLVKRSNLAQVASTSFRLLDDVPPKSHQSLNVAMLKQYLSRDDNASAFMSRSSLFRKAGQIAEECASSEEECQLSAKLNVLYGLPLEPSDEDIKTKLANPVHPYARSRVYDLRRYTEENCWGPFTDDGLQKVDWEKVQAILTVLGYNIQLLCERTNGQFSLIWDKPFGGLAQDSFSSRSLENSKQQPSSRLSDGDPYGVTGTWMRIVCFLDYTKLYSFNFENDDIPADQEREPICTEEAIRLIFLKLRVTKIEPPGEGDDPNQPVVFFRGTSRSMHMSWDPNANSMIRGTVRTTASGVVRWTTFSIYNGEERWRSEAVQIGGRKSARGSLGNWFDKDYDIHGPAGPTAFWKLSDDIVDDNSSAMHTQLPAFF